MREVARLVGSIIIWGLSKIRLCTDMLTELGIKLCIITSLKIRVFAGARTSRHKEPINDNKINLNNERIFLTWQGNGF